MTRPLAVEAWTLGGRPLPTYERANMPGRLFRAGVVLRDDEGP
jgi:hypothetical protein